MSTTLTLFLPYKLHDAWHDSPVNVKVQCDDCFTEAKANVTGFIPLIFSTPFNFPILPSMVVVQDRQTIPSIRIFTASTPLEERELGPSCASGARQLITSPSRSALIRDGTNVTARPWLSALSCVSTTPLDWSSALRACWIESVLQPAVLKTLVSVWTGVDVAFARLHSKPISSMASARDSGPWRVWS